MNFISKPLNSLTRRLFSLQSHSSTSPLLVNRVLPFGSEEHKDMWQKSTECFELSLNHRQTCDIELILNGGFSPLQGFMTKNIYDSVVKNSHLPSTLNNGSIWPMPICLDISSQTALAIETQGIKQIVLRDEEHNPIAVMDVEDIFIPDKTLEAHEVYGGDPEHPAVEYLKTQTKEMYIGGKLHGLQLPKHYDYKDLRSTPQELRDLFAERGWTQICAFQTRNPMHRAHIELTRMALNSDPNMNLLIHPVVGMTKPGDIDHHTRVKCYKAILDTYPQQRTCLSVFPLAMRMAGPREAIWHCLIRRNYGATHFILGRDHAGPGSNSTGVNFYSPFEARDAAVHAQHETHIKCMSFEQMVYCPEDQRYYPENEVKHKNTLNLSGTEVRRRLRTGEDIPDWFSYPNVVDILRTAHPPRHKQGITIFFTGLSGSGKSTVGNALREKLMELDARRLAILDGDHVRKLISSELTFSKDHRNLNIRRIGYIASLINGAGGIVIAAPIAPYEESRMYARKLVSEVGAFIEVFVSTPVEECAKRDTKGLYAKAMADPTMALTGVGDEPYEMPTKAEIVMDTTGRTVESCVDDVIQYLYKEGYLLSLEKTA